MEKISSAVAGLLFGAGLTLSGMVNPMKVLNFLDLFGIHDFTLAFVMGGGLLTALIGYQMLLNHNKPLFASRFHMPDTPVIDAKLLGGAALFGVGWGVSGMCPGPALAGLVFSNSLSFIFVGTMAAGILTARFMASVRNGS